MRIGENYIKILVRYKKNNTYLSGWKNLYKIFGIYIFFITEINLHKKSL
jgi:hypothetical protein